MRQRYVWEERKRGETINQAEPRRGVTVVTLIRHEARGPVFSAKFLT
jgi:hypothetical protein